MVIDGDEHASKGVGVVSVVPVVPKLVLRRDLQRQIRQGHPWLYRDAVEAAPDLPTGSVVDIVAKDGKLLGRGLWDATSPLAVRLYTDTRAPLDARFFSAQLQRAHTLRQRFVDAATTDGYRWCNGEGDSVPGVVVDRYAHVAVLRLDGEAIAALRPALVDAVAQLAPALGVRTLIERSRQAAHTLLWGEPVDGDIAIREHGVGFLVDVRHGQKTGLFLDQRESRALVRTIARGARVANLFSYTGGFSLYAASGGATRVDSVDVAAPAIEAARRNFAHNGWAPEAHGFFAEDVFAWLAARPRDAKYDVMIVDPPSFAPSEKTKDAALAAYRDVFARSLALVEDGGLFCPSSCSSHITTADFLETVQAAAQTERCRLQLVELRGQPADHPTPLPFVEGRYLKFAVLRRLG